MKNFKPDRFIVFCLAVYALSVFFEAGRLIAFEKTFEHVSMSIFSFLGCVASLLLLGYWIYEDEKDKNNVRMTFGLYEWMYKRLKSK